MFTGTLKPYQDPDVDRMVERGRMLIAYGTGLGKTVLSIAAVEELIGQGLVEHTVIVVQASLKFQWAQSIAKFTDVDTREVLVKDADGIKRSIIVPSTEYCEIIDGPPKKRLEQYQRIKDNRPDYVILTYEHVVNDWQHVRRTKPDCIVLDEATSIKSFRAKRTRKIKRFTAPYRYALTATPMENGQPEELFSIMQWVDPEVLGRFDLFDKAFIVRSHFGRVERYKNLPLFHTKMSECAIRRTREDPEVKPHLPEKTFGEVYSDLDPAAKKAYRYIAEELLDELKKATFTGSFDIFSHYNGDGIDEDNTAKGRIMSKMLALELLCDHPDLIVMSAMDWEDSERQRQQGVVKKSWPGSKYCYQLWQAGLLDDVVKTPKLDDAIAEYTRVLAEHPNNKIIVFTTYRNMLPILRENLPCNAVEFHGEMSASQKAAAKSAFQTDPDCRVFLSTDAGGYGVDLPEANYLYHYDLPWSSGRFDQRSGRHDRASSTHQKIYVGSHLIRGSVEVRKYGMVAFKGRVEKAIMDGLGQDRKGRVENDVVTLKGFLEESDV